MEAKHKNLLIGTLLAVVFVMAVGYAAFAQSLTVNGTSTITSKWDVHMKNGTTNPTSIMGTVPTPSLTVDSNGLTATLSTDLQSPGDKVVYTIPIVNEGTLDAVLNSITVTGKDGTAAALTVVDGGVTGTTTATTADGNIKYTVVSPGTNTLVNTTGTVNLVITAEYVNAGEQTNANGVKADLTVVLGYIQKTF